jgi:DNA-binding beta-propeller fold protein YncE
MPNKTRPLFAALGVAMFRCSVRAKLHTVSAALAIALVAGCSNGSAIAPKPVPPQIDETFKLRSPLSPIDEFNLHAQTRHKFKSFYACPAKGPIKYISDVRNGVINVYVGKFAGQDPCGQITSGLNQPQGLYVKAATHDLYVANFDGFNVLVFHRGQTTAYNTYTDASGQLPLDVTVAKDGTVIVSNYLNTKFTDHGSISTWIGGPNGGTFVGNFPITNASHGGFITVKKNGTVYYNDLDANTMRGALWSLACPAGVCGAQTQVDVAPFVGPAGMAIDATGDLLMNGGNGFVPSADTFELPNPNPKTFPIVGAPWGMAINPLDHHWFVADSGSVGAEEYLYPSGALVGTVAVNPCCVGLAAGIAVDP